MKIKIETIEDLQRFAKMAASSGMFKTNAKDQTAAIAELSIRIQCGAELGLNPVQSLREVDVIHGSMSLSAGLISALIKQSENYDYVIMKHTDDECVLGFYKKDGEMIGQSTFTIEDAKRANLLNNRNWREYTRAMLFARALTQGARWYTPDICGGPIYTRDELSSEAASEMLPSDIPSGLSAVLEDSPAEDSPAKEDQPKKTKKRGRPAKQQERRAEAEKAVEEEIGTVEDEPEEVHEDPKPAVEEAATEQDEKAEEVTEIPDDFDDDFAEIFE